MSEDYNRGEPQQAEYLVRAAQKITEAYRADEAGMSDPALALSDEAAAHLEAYRKGPKLVNNAEVDDG